jgi:hypothetical protein
VTGRQIELEALTSAALEDPETPEAVREALRRGAALESIRLDARGRWWHEGEPFVNERLSALFSSSLHLTRQGLWYLVVGAYSYPIVVEGAGRFVDRVERREGREVLVDWLGVELSPAEAAWWSDGLDQVGMVADSGRWGRLRGAALAWFLDRLTGEEDGWSVQLAGGERRLQGGPPPWNRLDPAGAVHADVDRSRL